MTRVGAFTMVWRETRYLPLVLEQLSYGCVDLPVVIWNDQPYYWYGEGSAPPSGHASKVGDLLAVFSHLPVIRLTGHSDTETVLRNVATKYLREEGAEVIQWVDSDFLFDFDDWRKLCAAMSESAPACWTVRARHLWRNWQTTYSTGNFRIGYPAVAEWNDGSFDRIYEENARHCDVVCWHPSYALSDQEVHDKVKAWFHAPLAEEAHWWERWKSRDWDREQDLKPLDIEVPAELRARLEAWNCLEGL
jgi:hypothetical protein